MVYDFFLFVLLQGPIPSVLVTLPNSPTTSGEAMPFKSKCPKQSAL